MDKNKKLALTISLTLGILLIGTFALYLFYENILHPSYVSVIGACNQEKFEKDFSQDYKIAGQVSYNSTNQSDYKVEIFIENPRVIRHEQCHIVQAESNRINSCDQPLRRLFDEMECYTAQYYLEGMFKIFYGD